MFLILFDLQHWDEIPNLLKYFPETLLLNLIPHFCDDLEGWNDRVVGGRFKGRVYTYILYI